MSDDLKERCYKFRSLELPGQPKAMHMGTYNLVSDLDNEVARLTAEVEALRVDARRLDWLQRAGDVSIGMCIDMPDDGSLMVVADLGVNCVGKTIREAIDKAMSDA